jgi:hypothetical protein
VCPPVSCSSGFVGRLSCTPRHAVTCAMLRCLAETGVELAAAVRCARAVSVRSVRSQGRRAVYPCVLGLSAGRGAIRR